MRLLMLVVTLPVSGAAVPAVAGPFEDGTAAYENGDYPMALRLWRPLAEQSDARAQIAFGYMYSRGNGVPQDQALAVSWYRKAAEQGDVVAQSTLSFFYFFGEGVPQDYAMAASWRRKAAEQGNAANQSLIGMMDADGLGVPQDYVLAHMWFNLSAAQGNADATKARDLIAAKMTPAQLAEAQRLAREWKPK